VEREKVSLSGSSPLRGDHVLATVGHGDPEERLGYMNKWDGEGLQMVALGFDSRNRRTFACSGQP
jgi:hypothetical protein